MPLCPYNTTWKLAIGVLHAYWIVDRPCGMVSFAKSFYCGLVLTACLPAFAAEWSWSWNPDTDDARVAASIETFKYGKRWAYSIEIDDGPKWVRSFAVTFLASYHYTDAPPGVPGGKSMPWVGSVAVIVGSIGNNDSNLNWDDLRAVLDAGWGVMNHSFDHRGYGWDGAAGALSDEAVRQDAYWSQAILAANLPGGRAPTAAAYANGYTDYNRNGVLLDAGIAIATRVGGGSVRDVTSPRVQWMDFTRSYLDEGVWIRNGKEAPMADFPADEKAGPSTGSFVIDFTHVIEQKPESPNQLRWRARLATIEERWGARGADDLWCAPTGAVADYIHAARAAVVRVSAGKVSVILPDNIPGSALTLRLTGIRSTTQLQAPAGGVLYRQGDAVFLTTPVIGLRGVAPMSPKVKKIYEGPAASVDFAKPERIAGVTVGIGGCPKTPVTYRIAARTGQGDTLIGERTLEAKWYVDSQLLPLVPTGPAIEASGILVKPVPELKRMTVWGIDDLGR